MGNKGDADARFERLLRKLGYSVLQIEKANGQEGESGVRVTEIRLKMDADSRTSVLVILKGVAGTEGLVAFAGGPDVSTAVLTVANRLQAGTLKWREDRPWPG